MQGAFLVPLQHLKSQRGQLLPLFRKRNDMIDKQIVIDAVNDFLSRTDAFLVDVTIDRENNIVVEIDSPTGIDLDACVELSHHIDESLDRDVEDYSLEVGSAGLTSPMKVRGQYLKNVGNDVEVLTRDGRKLHGKLTAVSDEADGSFTFTVEVPTKVKQPGAKRPTIVAETLTFSPKDVKSVVYDLKV